MVNNKAVIFAKIPESFPVAGEHVKVVDTEFDLDQDLQEGQIIVKLLYLSVDPYMQVRMDPSAAVFYPPPFDLNKPLTGESLYVVVRSNNPNFKKDDYVYSGTIMGSYQEYSLVEGAYAAMAFVVRNEPKTSGLPLSYYVGVLGSMGLTAYYGFNKIGKPVKGETIYISGASGAVGQFVSQFAKAKGLYVVGSAGSVEKMEYLKEIGFDAVFNYKEGDLVKNMKTHCPNGIDIYFDVVGGASLDAAILNMNNFGRIVSCGMLSQDNKPNHDPMNHTFMIIQKRLTIQGYIIFDHFDVEPEFMSDVTQLIQEKKIRYRENINEGIESTPEQLINVFQGKNVGRTFVHVADP